MAPLQPRHCEQRRPLQSCVLAGDLECAQATTNVLYYLSVHPMYVLQTCHAAKKAAAAGIGMYAAFLEAGAATGGATACSATIANANFIVDHIKHNKPASG